MNTPKLEPKDFTAQAAALSHSLEALRRTLCEIAAAGITFEAMQTVADLEEIIRRADLALRYSALDIAAAIRIANTSTPSAISADTTPDADNTESQ
jgi:head-tail adaptor